MKRNILLPELAVPSTSPAFDVEVGQLVRSVLNPCLLSHYYIGMTEIEALRDELLTLCHHAEIAAYLQGMQGYCAGNEQTNLTRFLYVACWWLRHHPSTVRIRLSHVASVLWVTSLVPMQRYGSATNLHTLMRHYSHRLPRNVVKVMFDVFNV